MTYLCRDASTRLPHAACASSLCVAASRRLAALGSLDPLILVEAVEEQRRVRLEVLAARSAALAAQLSLEALTAPCEAHAPSISPRSAESPPESERESP